LNFRVIPLARQGYEHAHHGQVDAAVQRRHEDALSGDPEDIFVTLPGTADPDLLAGLRRARTGRAGL
jgi:hypothetical protein